MRFSRSISLLFSSSFSNSEEICQDFDLADECQANAALEFMNCGSACDDSICEEKCLVDYRHELDSCPCGRDCPTGCQNCFHPICKDKNYFFVIGNYGEFRKENFIISTSGELVENREIAVPGNKKGYLHQVGHALLNDELFVFGGYYDSYKAAVLEGCAFRELHQRLIYDYSIGNNVQELGGEVFICFNSQYSDASKICQVFDGSSFRVHRSETSFTHQSGCLANYQGNLLAIGSYYSGDRSKVELLSKEIWKEQEQHPKQMALFGCLTIGDEKVITIGGFNVITNKPYDDIFAFENSSWRSAGKLLTPQFYSTVYAFGGELFSVLGGKSPYNIERLEMDSGNGNVTENTVIYSDFRLDAPIVFYVDLDFCAN
ncbi:unnamed protein product [Oikopleura dioica]|uniref:Uncharacterized protein n=1 Tax=Oikopleura dioica TaxID=34765 RepID=E4YPZ0_OIKDI|nr:unnamed protein product [Oikopleura dioica]